MTLLSVDKTLLLLGMEQPAPAIFDPNEAQAKQHKLIKVIGILVVVGVLLMIVIAIFGGEPRNSTLDSVLANNQAMTNLIEERRENLRGSSALNYLSTVQPVLLTHQGSLAGIGAEVKQSVQVDSTSLDSAQASGQLDDELTELIRATISQDLAKIESALNQANPDTSEYAVIERVYQDYQNLSGAQD